MAEMTLREEWIQGDGLRLHVSVAGVGPPVILLHGFPENGSSWKKQLAPLVAAGFSAWVPSLRGYPPSAISPRRADYHLRHLTADVAAVVAATGFPRAHVAGHDWGGVIAWTFAGCYPELLDKLVILNAPHMRRYTERVWRSSQFFRSLYAAFFQLPAAPELALSAGNFMLVRQMFRHLPVRRNTFSEHEIDRYVATLAQPGALKAALDYYRENFLSGGVPLASAVRTDAEVLVIWGERDPALETGLLEGLEALAPRVRIHRIATAGHWVQNEAPEEVNRALLNFLGDGRSGRPRQTQGDPVSCDP